MPARLLLLVSLLTAVAAAGWATDVPPPRPLLVTVDDLPIAGGGHEDPEERRRITDGLLGHLERHRIEAVGLVTWRNVRDETGRELLERWVAAGGLTLVVLRRRGDGWEIAQDASL